MKNINIEKLKTEQKTLKEGAAVRRALAVLLFVTGGDISFSGFTKDHAKRLKGAYLKHGIDAFKDKRTNQRDRILTRPEREAVITILKTKQPKDVIPGCESESWTTGLLGLYIKDTYGKAYKSKTSSLLLFREARLSWHCPGRVYEKADPVARATWIGQTTPVLQKLWDEPDTVILCEDEMVLTSATTIQKVWLPIGEYPPITETNTTRKRKSFYGFLNLKTGQEHAFVTDWQNMYITVEVLTEIRTIYPTQKIVLIWDNCGWHRGSKVTEWIDQDGNTKTIYFPPYTPDLNPQEHVWKQGRKAITHNTHIQKIEETAENFKDYLQNKTFNYELLGLRPA